MIASSLTSPILIMRKVFSRSFVISAASAELTECTVLIAPAYHAVATSPQAAVIPPNTFGVLIVVQSSRPGSTRSGENVRNQSSPIVSPRSVPTFGKRTSRVVPGYVVDSNTTTIPLWIYLASSSAAEIMNDISGSPVWRNGVGTQMLTASISFKTEKSVVAVKFPDLANLSIASVLTSGI